MTSEAEARPVTNLLLRMNGGDAAALDELMPLIYDELHGLASQVFASQGKHHTLQATALVHEAFLRMTGKAENRDWTGRRHFFGVAAMAMRQVLIDHARRHKRAKRRGDRLRVTLANEPGVDAAGYDLVDLGEALEVLGEVRERVARVVELRLLGGLTSDEVAEHLDISDRTVQLDWRAGRAWLRKRFGESDSD